jgi:arsenical pump membrane protein
MALPWVAVVVATGVALRLFFAADLRDDGPPAAEDGPPAANGPDADRPSAPRYALVVLGLTVAAAVLASSLHVAPAWAAAGGCLLLAGPRLARRQTTPLWLVREASPGFCVFVLALAVVVDGVTRNGLADALRHLVPDGQSLPTLLAIAALAAVLANLINNLPATLVLVPLVAGSPVAVLAVLLGVNIGPNLTYVGSLATLLWRRLLPDADRPRGRQFHRFGALSVPPILALATVLLWLSSLVVS